MEEGSQSNAILPLRAQTGAPSTLRHLPLGPNYARRVDRHRFWGPMPSGM